MWEYGNYTYYKTLYTIGMDRTKVNRLAVLFHHKWSAPILAELHADSGAKFVTLIKRLGLSRDSLSTTLATLIAKRWVRRNPGHGHPLRPEYVLTAAGAQLGPWCCKLMAILSALGVEELGLKKWSMPVALGLQNGLERFSELKAFLPGSTARAIALALKDLQTAGLVERVVVDDYPPATHYRLARPGRRLGSVLESL